MRVLSGLKKGTELEFGIFKYVLMSSILLFTPLCFPKFYFNVFT